MPPIRTIHETAAALRRSFGEKAQAIVAQRERQALISDRASEAEDWRMVREALLEARGPRAT